MSVPWEERPWKGEEVVPLARWKSTAGWAKGEWSLFCWCLLGVFPLSAVGLVIKKEWSIYVILEWMWGLSPWLMSSLNGLLLPVAQISPNEFLSLCPADELLDICNAQLRLQFVHKGPSWSCFQRRAPGLGDITSPGYWSSPTVKLFYVNFVFFYIRYNLVATLHTIT